MTSDSDRLRVSDLVGNPAFRLILELDLDDLADFLKQHAQDDTPLLRWYRSLVVVLAGLWLGGAGAAVLFDAGVSLAHLPGTIALTLVILLVVVVPLHEALHVLTLVFYGARDLRFRFSLRKLYIAVTVHHFVASSREIIWMAILPFLVINVMLMVLFAVSSLDKFLLGGLLFLHTFLCAGDIINISLHPGERERYSYVDAEANKVFLYECRTPAETI